MSNKNAARKKVGQKWVSARQTKPEPARGPNSVQHLATKNFTFDGQAPPLVVVEHNAAFAELLTEHPVFSSQILDYLLLLAVYPARQDHEQELPGLENKTHGAIQMPIDRGQ